MMLKTKIRYAGKCKLVRPTWAQKIQKVIKILCVS